MKGIATLEWIVIVAIVLLMISGALELWQSAWEPAMERALTSSTAFEAVLSGL